MTLKIGNKGFTLMEIMVATVVLSLGTVLIYGAFFTSLDAFSRYTNYLNLIPWMDEQVWQVQDNLSKFGSLARIQTSGGFQKSGKTFNWGLNYSLIDGGLYKIDLDLYWQQGQIKAGLSRSAYAEYKKKE